MMRRGKRTMWVITVLSIAVASCAGADASEDTTTTSEEATTTSVAVTTTAAAPDTTTTSEAMDHSMDEDAVDTDAVVAANLGAAAFQDVEVAESAGYVSTMESLGCFENPDTGGMGLHYLNEGLLDDTVDEATPEALVYELDSGGEIVDLVAHEYLVPFEAWTSEEPPSLFGLDFHEHPTLPFWILHAWIWKDNPSGMFNDWNPKVRMCPDDVPIFGVDLP